VDNAQAQRTFDAYRQIYNSQRPHQALGYPINKGENTQLIHSRTLNKIPAFAPGQNSIGADT